jgi:hypothetical protein
MQGPLSKKRIIWTSNKLKIKNNKKKGGKTYWEMRVWKRSTGKEVSVASSNRIGLVRTPQCVRYLRYCRTLCSKLFASTAVKIRRIGIRHRHIFRWEVSSSFGKKIYRYRYLWKGILNYFFFVLTLAKNLLISTKFSTVYTRVADPDPFDTDPDPAFSLWSGSGFSIWCGSGSPFDTDPDSYRFKEVMYGT